MQILCANNNWNSLFCSYQHGGSTSISCLQLQQWFQRFCSKVNWEASFWMAGTFFQNVSPISLFDYRDCSVLTLGLLFSYHVISIRDAWCGLGFSEHEENPPHNTFMGFSGSIDGRVDGDPGLLYQEPRECDHRIHRHRWIRLCFNLSSSEIIRNELVFQFLSLTG